MSKQKFIVFIDLSSNRYWSRSVLGKIFNIVIDDVPMKIHFPGLPVEWHDETKNDYLHYNLAAPQVSKKYKYGDEEIFYGVPRTYPGGSSIVERIVISFELNELEVEERIKSIYQIIENAMNKFYKLCYIVNCSVNPSDMIHQPGKGIDIYNDSLKKRVPNHQEIELTGHFHEDSDSITKKQLDTILNIITNGKEIPAEYDYLISGIKAYENHDNRKCVLELSTACEIAITAKIEELQNALKIKNFLEDYKMLGAKYKLLGLLNFDISFADISVITNARNDAIHKGIDVKSKQAYDAIKVTRTILNKLSKFY